MQESGNRQSDMPPGDVKTRPQITVITPIYNGVHYLEGCVENVRDQRIENLEHLIIDGGSTDGTASKLAGLARQYSHLRFISERDAGQSDAMNKGVRLAASGIIGFLNVDDFYEQGAISAGLKFLTENPDVDIVVGQCRTIDESGHEISVNRPSDLRLESLLLGWEFAQYPGNPSAYFYRKTIHEKIGDYDTADHYAMDLKFILSCASQTNMRYVPAIWGNFRSVPGTKTYTDREFAPARVLAIRNRWIATLTPMQRLRMKLIKLQKRVGRKKRHLTGKIQDLSLR